jgi:Phage Single-stranded DNA-binding protein
MSRERKRTPLEAEADEAADPRLGRTDPSIMDCHDAPVVIHERPAPLVPTRVEPRGRCIATRGAPFNLCPTSLNLTTREGARKAFNARTSASLAPSTDGTMTIQMADWIALWVEGIDEATGEPASYPWLVLIDPDGGQIGTSSPVVAHQLADLLDMVQAGLLALPITVRITPTRSKKRGQVYHSLSIVEGE